MLGAICLVINSIRFLVWVGIALFAILGTDSDGYGYKFIQTGEGTYDVCQGEVEIEYDIYYLDGGAWVYWYAVKNTLSIQ